MGKFPSEIMEMDSYDFALLAADYERMPWGEFHADVMIAELCRTIVSYSGKTRKENAPSPTLEEFMPFHRPKPEPAADDYQSLQHFFKGK